MTQAAAECFWRPRAAPGPFEHPENGEEPRNLGMWPAFSNFHGIMFEP